jgi:hypothetical protein
MECPLWRLLISSRSVSKHGHHMQFLFLIGRFLKNLLLWNCLAIWTETWYEASTCMEGSVLSFLKAEWKVSDTGSAHWASRFSSPYIYHISHNCSKSYSKVISWKILIKNTMLFQIHLHNFHIILWQKIFINTLVKCKSEFVPHKLHNVCDYR